MRFLIVLILLAFPILEIAILIQLCERYSWWVLVYLILIGYLGIQLIRSEKDLIARRIFQQMGAHSNPVGAIFSSARTMFAGVLLLVPGVVTDAIAVILLLIPTPKDAAQANSKSSPFRASANDDVIEGEFTEVNEHTSSDKVVPLPRRTD